VARTGTVHHLRIDLSDVDRAVYESLDLRVAQHPSESARRVLTKTLAYALLYAEGIEFARGGLSDTDEPEISIRDAESSQTGRVAEWIEVGSPASDRLKRATNSSRHVTVFCTNEGQGAEGVVERARALPRGDRVTVMSVEASFVDALAEQVAAAGGRFALVRSGGHLYATCGGVTLDAPLKTTAIDAS
jgi:uncharacterized protein YaeQ